MTNQHNPFVTLAQADRAAALNSMFGEQAETLGYLAEIAMDDYVSFLQGTNSHSISSF